MNPNYPLVASRAAHRCEYCRAPEVIFNIRFEVEHVIPLSKGGTDEISNLALSCRKCNLYKSNMTTGLDPVTGEKTPLFNPREHDWDDHFQLVGDPPVLLKGKTAMGRATINQLQMNAQMQLIARMQWVNIGLYP